MFRKIIIVRLRENNALLNFTLNWPAKVRKNYSNKGNIELLRYGNVIKGNLSRCIMNKDGQSGYKTIVVPIGYNVQDRLSEWITDMSDMQFECLTETIQSVLKDIHPSPSKQYWYWNEKWVEHDLKDQYVIDGRLPIAKDLSELEMVFYAHPVNGSRSVYKQSKITGVMLGNVEKNKRYSKTKVVGDSRLISLFQNQTPLAEWLEKPYTNCTIIMGSEVGDQELYRVKETILQMMESSQCDLVEVIQSSSHEIYSASWFYNLYSKLKDYFFLKQAM